MKETLEDHLCNTLKELKQELKWGGLKKNNIAMHDQMLKCLKAIDYGHATKNILNRWQNFIDGAPILRQSTPSSIFI